MKDNKNQSKSDQDGEASASVSLSVRAMAMVGQSRKEGARASFEERLERLAALLGDGQGLLKHEAGSDFAVQLEGMRSFSASKGSVIGLAAELRLLAKEPIKDRLAIENFVAQLEFERDGEAWEIALRSLLRCGALDQAPKRVAEAVCAQIRDALLYSDRSRPADLAGEWMGSFIYQKGGNKTRSKGAALFLDDLKQIAFEAVVPETEGWLAVSFEVIDRMLDAAEQNPDLRAASAKGAPKGEVLKGLVAFNENYCEPEGVRIYERLCARAKIWIEKEIDAPEPGEMAWDLSLAIKEAVKMENEEAARAACGVLIHALAHGMGVRRARGEQPLKTLMSVRTFNSELADMVSEAGQALIDAGSSAVDLVEGVEEALAKAPNQRLATRLRANMESRELSESLKGLSAEEMEMVEAFRRSKREKPAGEASASESKPRRPGL